jgi:hypothetical protein
MKMNVEIQNGQAASSKDRSDAGHKIVGNKEKQDDTQNHDGESTTS